MTLLRSLDREQKILGGVLAAFGILAFVFVGVSRDASGSARPMLSSTPPAAKEEAGTTADRATKSDPTPTARPAPEKAPTPTSRSSSARRNQSAGQAEAPGQTPQAAAPAGEAPETTANPEEKTASPPAKRAPDKAVARVRAEPKPTIGPELTSAQIRSLPASTTLASAVAALGQPLTTAELRGKYGAGPIQLLLGQQPTGSVCRYYGLATGEPAPLVRLCFDAKGFLLTREFVAPPPKA